MYVEIGSGNRFVIDNASYDSYSRADRHHERSAGRVLRGAAHCGDALPDAGAGGPAGVPRQPRAGCIRCVHREILGRRRSWAALSCSRVKAPAHVWLHVRVAVAGSKMVPSIWCLMDDLGDARCLDARPLGLGSKNRHRSKGLGGRLRRRLHEYGPTKRRCARGGQEASSGMSKLTKYP